MDSACLVFHYTHQLFTVLSQNLSLRVATFPNDFLFIYLYLVSFLNAGGADTIYLDACVSSSNFCFPGDLTLTSTSCEPNFEWLQMRLTSGILKQPALYNNLFQ